MASSVCDRTPCEMLELAIKSIADDSYRDDRFSIRVWTHLDSRVSFLVPLKYCPFCGTRIEPGWAKSFYRPVERERRVR